MVRLLAVISTSMTYRRVLALLILILSVCGILQYHSNFIMEHLVMEQDSHSDSLPRAGRQGYYVRHCTTGRILGKAPSGLQTIPFKVSKGSSPEIAENRKSSFENIFKTKEWIRPDERKNENRASGKRILHIITRLSIHTYKYMYVRTHIPT